MVRPVKARARKQPAKKKSGGVAGERCRLVVDAIKESAWLRRKLEGATTTFED